MACFCHSDAGDANVCGNAANQNQAEGSYHCCMDYCVLRFASLTASVFLHSCVGRNFFDMQFIEATRSLNFVDCEESSQLSAIPGVGIMS